MSSSAQLHAIAPPSAGAPALEFAAALPSAGARRAAPAVLLLPPERAEPMVLRALALELAAGGVAAALCRFQCWGPERAADPARAVAAASRTRAKNAADAPFDFADWEALPDRAALAELELALRWLGARADVDARRVRVLGLGWSGALAFVCACTCTGVSGGIGLAAPLVLPRLSANKPFQPIELALSLSGGWLAIDAELDAHNGAEQRALRALRLDQAAREHSSVLLPGATPRFLDPASPGYDARVRPGLLEHILEFARRDD